MNTDETGQQQVWSNNNETNIQWAAINEIVKSRIMGLLMLQHIINKLKERKENKTEEHVMPDDRIIIVDYRVNPPSSNAITEEIKSQNNDE